MFAFASHCPTRTFNQYPLSIVYQPPIPTHTHTPVLPDEGVEGVAIGHPSNETAVGGKRDDGVPEGGHIRGKGVGKVVRINRI